MVFGTVFGQKSLHISYKVESNFDLNEMKHEQTKSMATMAAAVMSDFEFQLLIANDESIFKQSKHQSFKMSTC